MVKINVIVDDGGPRDDVSVWHLIEEVVGEEEVVGT